MKKPVRIAASILSADFMKLGEEVRKAEVGGADIIHVDVMDGRFVPNMTVGPMIIRAIRKVTSLPLDVHLMVEDPDWFVQQLEGSGVNMISVHPEVARHLGQTLENIRKIGVKGGVALNPSTPLDAVECPLEDLDYLLTMTVNPGFGGQAFLPTVLPKIGNARRKFDDMGLDIDIEVDGGINAHTASQVTDAGANILVAGAAIYGSLDVSRAIEEIRRSIRAAARKP